MQRIQARLSPAASDKITGRTSGVGRTPYGGRAPVQDVGINHRRADIVVPKKLLDGADVVAILQQVCRKGVSQGMGTTALGDARSADGVVHGAL